MKNTKLILREIEKVLDSIDTSKYIEFVEQFCPLNRIGFPTPITGKIIGIGAGRVGMAVKAFCMRLGHLGYRSWFIGDTTVPHIEKGDTLFVASGSGETKTIAILTKIAKENGARIICVTGNKESTIAKLSDFVLEMKVPSAVNPVNGWLSQQPMTTLNEQCLFLLLDSVVLGLMGYLNQDHYSMWHRHSNLE